MQVAVEYSQTSSESEDEHICAESPFLPFLQYLLSFILLWQFAYKISNSAISSLLRFLRQFISYLGNAFQCGSLIEMGDAVPLTLCSVYRLLSLQKDDFCSYVVCSTCDSIYGYSDCFELDAIGQKKSKKCCHVAFPNHPHASHRSPCGTILLNKVRTKKGYVLSPVKVYPFKPLKNSIQQLINRKGFLDSCEMWRKRSVPDQYICDIYEGAVWKQFNSNEGYDFLTSPYCYLLSLNVDWFEPFERGVYSVGAIYLTTKSST